MQVPYISDAGIERAAAALIEAARASGVTIAAPIPIEGIVEKHLRLGYGFYDLHERLGVPRSQQGAEIAGALWVDRGEIGVDEALDPDMRPGAESRFRFTLGHEVGHWVLHRQFLRAEASVNAPEPLVVCRADAVDRRVEFQANAFAAALLMPEPLVRKAWCRRYGDERPRRLVRGRGLSGLALVDSFCPAPRWATEGQARYEAERVVAPIAAQFLVSSEAMRIRLERLGLLAAPLLHGCVA